MAWRAHNIEAIQIGGSVSGVMPNFLEARIDLSAVIVGVLRKEPKKPGIFCRRPGILG